jgi:hypothetical protein
MRFNLEDPGEFDQSSLERLAREPVFTADGELGHISHFLVTPETSQVEWAVVVNEIGSHHAIPVDLLDLDDDEEAIRVRLHSAWVASLLEVTPPESTSGLEMHAQVSRILTGLRDAFGDNLNLDMAQPAGGENWNLVSLGNPDIPAPIMVWGVPWGSGEVSDGHGTGDAVEATGDAVEAESPPNQRSLVADLPTSVGVMTRFSVEARIVEEVAGSPSAGSILDVKGGMTVTVNATVPGSFKVEGDLTQDIAVPLTGDSDPCRFSFTATQVGTFNIRLTAYNGGKYLGMLEVEVSVATATSGTSRHFLNPLPLDPQRDGEVSLEITYDEASKTFRFNFMADGDHRPSPSAPIVGDLRERVERLVGEIEEYAAGKSDLSHEDIRGRLKIKGFELWRDLVPSEIKSAILDYLPAMSQLTIFCDREVVPWELLYPQGPDGSVFGFLVELCSVTRWVLGKPWKRELSFAAPAFVIPEQTAGFTREVELVTGRMNAKEPQVLKDRSAVLTAIGNPDFTCLHFACHNLYAQIDGSHILFGKDPLRPSDMALEVARRPLEGQRALVFLNACRTDDSSPVYTSLESWAKTFLDLGATAVIGTSWAVRARTARFFADALYENLAGGMRLGEAAKQARQRASELPGDSSWLAYTVYGDADASVVTP